MFDKTSRKKKTKDLRNKVLDFERANTNDPMAFWDYIKCLTLRKISSIPWETFDDNNELTTDNKQVLLQSSEEFCGLLTPPEPTEDMLRHLEQITA